jgi:Tfp pilus assembly protein PilN
MSQQINLFNPNLVKKKSRLTSTTLLGLAGFSIVVLVVMSVWVSSVTAKLKLNETERQQQLTLVQNQLQAAQANVKPQKEDPKLIEELEQLRLSLADRDRVETILSTNKLGNTLGYSEYLSAFARQIPNGVWITGFHLRGAGDEISLKGRATLPDQVPIFVNQLKREKIMQGKTFSALSMQRPLVENVGTSNPNVSKPAELAPYVEFELHSTEQKEKRDSAGKLP